MFRRPRDDDPSRLTVRDSLPVFADLGSEPQGALWAVLYSEQYEQRIWVRLTPEGHLDGKIILPAEMEVLDANFPFLLVRSPEPNGLQSLYLVRLRRVMARN